ncbi:hypothetical protein [Pseudarcicella hirudinis]|uniref:hypothetical protein n=1 Tax=Pseudarcicella hirudinis TaxID=1079859 RepID=UPI001160721D|nr:hypothetical protein [Pseudarcicella hirudinis]
MAKTDLATPSSYVLYVPMWLQKSMAKTDIATPFPYVPYMPMWLQKSMAKADIPAPSLYVSYVPMWLQNNQLKKINLVCLHTILFFLLILLKISCLLRKQG